jgi:hypothetical protein
MFSAVCAVVVCRQDVAWQRGRSIAESIFVAFPFLIHTLLRLSCTSAAYPYHQLQTCHVRGRAAYNARRQHHQPYYLLARTALLACLLVSLQQHSTRPSKRPHRDTVLPPPQLLNFGATRHIAASSFDPSKHFPFGTRASSTSTASTSTS